MPTRRMFADVAQSLAGMFDSRSNDLEQYWAIGILCHELTRAGLNDANIDLISRRVSPDFPVLRRLPERYGDFLPGLCGRIGVPQSWVGSAVIDVAFESLSDHPVPQRWLNRRGARGQVLRYWYQIQVTIVDDRNQTWSTTNEGVCWPDDFARFPRRIMRSRLDRNDPATYGDEKTDSESNSATPGGHSWARRIIGWLKQT